MDRDFCTRVKPSLSTVTPRKPPECTTRNSISITSISVLTTPSPKRSGCSQAQA
jgi:hypothetical protein